MSKDSIACIALKKGKVLLAHRNSTGQMGNRWEFPGGKVEEGETFKQSVVREMKEEFGIKVRVGQLICETKFIHNENTVLLHCFAIKVPHMGRFFKYRLTEHTEYKWAEIDEVEKLNFVDSDLLLYPEVKKWVKSQLKENS